MSHVIPIQSYYGVNRDIDRSIYNVLLDKMILSVKLTLHQEQISEIKQMNEASNALC